VISRKKSKITMACVVIRKRLSRHPKGEGVRRRGEKPFVRFQRRQPSAEGRGRGDQKGAVPPQRGQVLGTGEGKKKKASGK